MLIFVLRFQRRAGAQIHRPDDAFSSGISAPILEFDRKGPFTGAPSHDRTGARCAKLPVRSALSP